MTDLTNTIKDFEKRSIAIKSQYEILKRKESNIMVIDVSGISFYENMELTLFNTEDLDLGHVLLHKSYSDKNSLLPKEWIKSLHSLFVQEFQKRGKMHYQFDRLDEISFK